jgi:hypothetical protein
VNFKGSPVQLPDQSDDERRPLSDGISVYFSLTMLHHFQEDVWLGSTAKRPVVKWKKCGSYPVGAPHECHETSLSCPATIMKLQHLIWTLAGGALLLVLALAARQGSGSREPINASAPEPVAVQAAAGSATPAPDVPAAAPVAVVPPAASDEATAPTASPDVNAADPMTDRERVAQQRARAH